MCRIHRFLAPVLLLGMFFPGFAQGAEQGAECRWTDHPPVIDGSADDPAWKGATILEDFGQPWLPGAPRVREGTKVRLLWDREWLYWIAEMEDHAVSRVQRGHDGPVWQDDAFEIFLKPSKNQEGYFEFEVSPVGAIVDAFFREAESWRVPGELRRDPFHVEAKTTIHETGGEGRPRGWTAEGRIPWSDFNLAGGRPAPGEVWSLNLARVNGPDPASELSTIANLTLPIFHRTAEYVPLRFAGPQIQKAPGWENTRLHGAPGEPPRYAVSRAYPKLKRSAIVTAEPVPGSDWMLYVTQSAYREGETTLGRFNAKGDGSDAQPLFVLAEVAYSLAFHPHFAENGFVFIGANGPADKPPRTSMVLRYTMKDGRLDPASRETILEWPSDGHNGAALAFSAEGYLFVTSGDGSVDSDLDHAGQNLRSLRSKILRIDVDRPEPGRKYRVPADNPFVGDERFAPETWAYGLRNPWRLTFDRESGQLWVGENGQDQWEYARLVQRGQNYGWSHFEGSHSFRPEAPLGPQPVTFPTIEHAHSEFRSLTGGVVYRGRAFPELAGAYIYGDWGTGRIWAAKHDGTRLEWQRELCDTPFAISQFTTTPDGEILVVDYGSGAGGGFHQLIPAAPASHAPFPAKLSETGLFTDVESLTPAPGLLGYEINAPGWHDGASSQHHLGLPKGGSLEARSSKSWQAPDDTVLAQTLTVEGRRIETRVLVKQQNDWAGYSFVWDADQKEAQLADAAGADAELRNGQAWRVPSRAECMMCHSRQANFALTLHDAQLNVGDQLQRWERAGLLTANAVNFNRERQQAQKLSRAPEPEPGQRNGQSSPLLPADLGKLAKFAAASDLQAGIEIRARSYLGANCAHCHTMYGGGNSAMEFDWLVPPAELQAFDRAPQHGTFDLPDARVIAPGTPARSVVISRVARRGPGQMPPAGSRVADPNGVRVLAEWIQSLRAK